MFTTLTRRAVAAAAILMLTAGTASAENQTKSDNFQLTAGDFTELSFKPGAAGTIRFEADWNGTGAVKKDVALRIQLVRPNGTVEKEAVGGSPLPVTFALTVAEFNQNKGKTYKIVLRHNVAGQPPEQVKGVLKVTFPNGTVTVFNDSARPIDLAGEGAKTEVSFTLPNKPGRVEVEVKFPNPILDVRGLTVQLIRADGTVAATASGKADVKLSHNVTQAELNKGLGWKVRLTNNGPQTVKKIAIVVKDTPN